MTPEDLLVEADRCVKCGLCLTVCPTYRLLASEADSPRGRISLIQALAKNELDIHSHAEQHLDRCLNCRACESACPSGVKYGSLLDASRSSMTSEHRKKPLLKRLLHQLSRSGRLNFWIRLYHIIRQSGLLALARKLPAPRFKQLLAMADQLPRTPVDRAGFYPSTKPTGKKVQLFTGCIGSKVDDNLVQSAIRLLSGLGYAVDIPPGTGCCGAMHRHNGFFREAEQQCDAIRTQTAKSSAQYLITLATACHLELAEQQVSRLPLVSISDFLLQLPDREMPELAPMPIRAALHRPCSSRDSSDWQILNKIPQLELVELAENELCCGAAGSYLLTQPEISNQLGEIKLAHLKASGAKILITASTGCAMQFRQQIRQAGLSIEVQHPIELIYKQWRSAGMGTQ
ncbi:MAG: (Fe-S)-binding protein [Candidatus Thiodiazotropha lotti]|uniref:Glycolate oxidase iron-sulfur subunit n=1 Tax=Candidatus Thiodiazotropha lotti TaxID=2792787 RepID=A0A9E4K4D7_9GAMM|nr:(Fe-S)-binding protein [Candidatus Thiodiazotropha lotti]MCW4203664.1 (Fe-S)-binding protein [Candidatus Thiodiazotropha lotti]